MQTRHIFLTLLILLVVSTGLIGQYTPWMYWTLLPEEIMAEIIGETSGETAWKTIMETGGYNKDRLEDEYESTFYESQYIYEQLKKYGLPGANITRFPGGTVWDGIEGELWEVNPSRQKMASYLDNTAMLVRGSRNADVKTELIWVGQGQKKDLDGLDVKGKIVVTEGGVSQSRPAFDPLQIPWSGIRNRGNDETVSGFAFYLPFREGLFLKQRLLRGEKITVEARVRAEERPYTLHRLIESGRIPRPRRTIRFLWGPEFSGTGPWVKANRERIHRSGTRFPYSYPRRIVAPFGADEPFIYSIETHYGASDHEVFNDWGVQVPGVMMIAWPDQWYHTSGDRVNKADPTQLKRAAVIGAAAALGVEPVEIVWSEEELDAQKIIPVPTSQVREKGYRGYREYLDAVPEDVQKKYAYRRGNIAGTSELQCLINGENSILDIKLMLDSQFEKESVLKDILHYMELLKAAGLITYK